MKLKITTGMAWMMQNAPKIGDVIEAEKKKARQEEREACAKLCDEETGPTAWNLALAIRARGNAP